MNHILSDLAPYRKGGSLSLKEASTFIGLGMTKTRELVASGELPAKRLGRRVVVLFEDAQAFLANLPAVKPEVVTDTAPMPSAVKRQARDHRQPTTRRVA